MLKLVLFVLLTSTFVLIICNKAIKFFNHLLLKRNYKFTEKFTYFLAGFVIFTYIYLTGKRNYLSSHVITEYNFLVDLL